jgi:hypothetical protein
MDNKIKDLISETINNNSLVKINDNLYLKRYQIDVLDSYHIDYKTCSSVSELLFLIDDILENDEIDDYDMLAEVADSLQEFNYYHNTNK